MACQKNKPSKSILKAEQDQGPELGAYNIYAKRASFKDDVIFQQFLHDNNDTPAVAPPVIEALVPIAPDVTEQELSPEQARKRDEFKKKRRMVDLEGTDGLDLKAVLAHRVSLTQHDEEDEDDDDDDDQHKSSLRNVEENDSDWSFSEPDKIDDSTNSDKPNQGDSDPLTYSVPQVVNRVDKSESSTTNVTQL